ncbi:MAG: hypothetical protein JWL83_4462 [Actinomycetia bacterium]|nr:hypothetical protein [Actinomycetes bacterium]
MARNVVDLRSRRAPAAPPDRWFEWCLEHDGAEVAVVESPSGHGPGSHDAWLTLGRDAGLRLAAIDGASVPTSPAFCGLDAATWAAQVTRASLLAEDDLAVCLWRANRNLFDPSFGRAGARAQAAVAVADIRARWDGDAHAKVVRASDCTVFARFGRRWVDVFPAPCVTAEAAQVWDAWCATHATANARDRAEAQDRALGAPEAWRTAAIGRFAEPLLECKEIEGFDELVLASGGARLDVARLDELDEWLDGLRRWERTAPRGAKVSDDVHDDATVLRWRRPDAPLPHPSRAGFNQ